MTYMAAILEYVTNSIVPFSKKTLGLSQIKVIIF